MSAQLSLTYDPRTTGHEVWLAQLEAIRAAVNYLGLKEVSFSLDVSGSMLSDALNERDRKRWAAAWTPVVQQMLRRRSGDEIALKLAVAIAEALLLETEMVLESALADVTDDELAAAAAAIAKLRRKKAKG